MIEKNEMDGGFSFANGKRLQIILDENGVFKRTEPDGAQAKGKPSSMDQASAKAAASKTPPVASLPSAEETPAAGAGEQGGARSGTGFKAPM